MKELSIEEKAKHYDKAIEKIQKYVKDDYGCTRLRPEDIFPELNESEDEKTRKELISFVRRQIECHDKPNVERDEKFESWIAWLEKQGEQEPAKNIVETWKDMRLEVYQQASGNRHEPNCSDDTTKMFSLNDIDEIVEKMSEQSPTNMVEPKFKVGDWLIRNDIVGVACCIAQIHEPYYYLTNDHTFISFREEDQYRLWTIQDAKDGDVLVHNGCTFIFMGIKNGIVMGFEENIMDGKNPVCFGEPDKDNDYCPATKKQRDILMKAMADAGYTFDFEKKELKKIENEIEIPFGAKDSELQEATYYIAEGFHAEIDDDKVVIKKGGKPTAWSEEDEEMLDTLISDYEFLSKKYRDKEHDFFVEMSLVKDDLDMISWLKSIKDRIQPKQEWSEEDESYLNTTIAYLKDAKEFKKTAENCINWLKSLKPQK